METSRSVNAQCAKTVWKFHTNSPPKSLPTAQQPSVRRGGLGTERHPGSSPGRWLRGSWGPRGAGLGLRTGTAPHSLLSQTDSSPRPISMPPTYTSAEQIFPENHLKGHASRSAWNEPTALAALRNQESSLGRSLPRRHPPLPSCGDFLRPRSAASVNLGPRVQSRRGQAPVPNAVPSNACAGRTRPRHRPSLSLGPWLLPYGAASPSELPPSRGGEA